MSRGESEVVSAPASGMNLVARRMHGSERFCGGYHLAHAPEFAPAR